MIAFMDAEYNTDHDSSSKRTDISLIEVALIVTKDDYMTQVGEIYHTYVKPVLNNGILYDRIKNLTAISQEQVDNGKNFTEVADDINKLIEKYHISVIYTWGEYDNFAFRWNFSQHNDVKNKNRLIKRMVDAIPMTWHLFHAKDVSLSDAAFICDCMEKNKHNAVDDTVMLKNVVYQVNTGVYNEEKLSYYDEYKEKRAAYNLLKGAVTKLKKANLDAETALKNILNGEEYPSLEEELKEVLH